MKRHYKSFIIPSITIRNRGEIRCLDYIVYVNFWFQSKFLLVLQKTQKKKIDRDLLSCIFLFSRVMSGAMTNMSGYNKEYNLLIDLDITVITSFFDTNENLL